MQTRRPNQLVNLVEAQKTKDSEGHEGGNSPRNKTTVKPSEEKLAARIMRPERLSVELHHTVDDTTGARNNEDIGDKKGVNEEREKESDRQ
jgi:hypothetical protein